MTNICLAFLGSGVSFIFGYTHILLAPNGAPHVNLPTVNDVGECATVIYSRCTVVALPLSSLLHAIHYIHTLNLIESQSHMKLHEVLRCNFLYSLPLTSLASSQLCLYSLRSSQSVAWLCRYQGLLQ